MTQVKDNKTFILHLQFKQNDSWQGSIKWVESKKTILFRSALEMIKIIESTSQQDDEIEVECLNQLRGKAAGDQLDN